MIKELNTSVKQLQRQMIQIQKTIQKKKLEESNNNNKYI
jgi:hypothetical protein